MKFVCIGGGTGLSTVLSGLKSYVRGELGHPPKSEPLIETLTAVVTVTDDGGSSGRLREEFQILPPGDIRNCMVALAEDELLMTKLFQYRFTSEGDLSGHSFGNLFLAALASVTGDFLEAIKVTSEVLAIKGRIYPSTVQDVSLVAELENGQEIRGETNIVESRMPIKRLWLSDLNCQPLPETIVAIREADVITIGPGSLYTSIIPNLLVEGIVDAIRTSSAQKVYVANIMTQPGETEGFSFQDHLNVLSRFTGGLRYDLILANSTPISGDVADRYLRDGAVPVFFNESSAYASPKGSRLHSEDSAPQHGRIVAADLLCQKAVVRHDPDKLATILLTECVAELGASFEMK